MVIALILIAPFVFCAESKISDHKLLVLTEQLYPMNYTKNGDDDGKILGFSTELVIAILEEANLEYEISMVPWARAIHSINKNKNVLVYSMTRSIGRKDTYHWIGDIWEGKINLYGHRDRLKAWPLALAEIKKLKVGASRGSVSSNHLESNGFDNIVTTKSIDNYMKLLERGRIDLFPHLGFSVNMVADRLGFDKTKLISVLELSAISPNLALAAGKNTDVKIVKRLRLAYKKIKQSSRYDEIMAPLKVMIDDLH